MKKTATDYLKADNCHKEISNRYKEAVQIIEKHKYYDKEAENEFEGVIT